MNNQWKKHVSLWKIIWYYLYLFVVLHWLVFHIHVRLSSNHLHFHIEPVHFIEFLLCRELQAQLPMFGPKVWSSHWYPMISATYVWLIFVSVFQEYQLDAIPKKSWNITPKYWYTCFKHVLHTNMWCFFICFSFTKPQLFFSLRCRCGITVGVVRVKSNGSRGVGQISPWRLGQKKKIQWRTKVDGPFFGGGCPTSDHIWIIWITFLKLKLP